MSSKYDSSVRTMDWRYAQLWLMPRPWGNCGCVKCIAWMIEDLGSAVESDGGSIQTLLPDLARWNVWLPYHYCPIPDYCSRQPVYVDNEVMAYMTQKEVINWCPTTGLLYPIKTTGDGNCLPHAIALALWGVQDNCMILRHLLYKTLVSAGNKLSFRERWQREKEWQNSNIPDGGLQYSKEEWEKEWSILVTAAEDLRREFDNEHPTLPYESLEEMHVFVLSNILKRPIIILGEPDLRSPFAGYAIAQNNFIGIYLPLLWKPAECHPYPIVLCFLMNHFQPLVTKMPLYPMLNDWHRSNVVPLVTSSLEMLRIHFLLENEEVSAHEVLQKYLYIDEIPRLNNPDARNDILSACLAQPELLFFSNIIREAPITQDELNSIFSEKEHQKEQLYSRILIPIPPPSELCFRSTALLINNSRYSKAQKMKMLALCQSGSLKLTTVDKWTDSFYPACKCPTCINRKSSNLNRSKYSICGKSDQHPGVMEDEVIYAFENDVEGMPANVEPFALPLLPSSSRNVIQPSNKTQIYGRSKLQPMNNNFSQFVDEIHLQHAGPMAHRDCLEFACPNAGDSQHSGYCILCCHENIFMKKNLESLCKVSGCSYCRIIYQYKTAIQLKAELPSEKSACNSELMRESERYLYEGESLHPGERKCRNPNCPMVGFFDNYCKYCTFLKRMYSVPSSVNKCLTKNCQNTGFESGFCDDCAIKVLEIQLSKQHKMEEKQLKEFSELHKKQGAVPKASSPKFGEIRQKQKATEIRILEGNKPTISNNCDGRMGETPKELFIERNNDRHVDTSFEEQKIETLAGNKVSQCKENNPRLSQGSKYQCIGPSCRKFGKQERQGLCENCYEELCVGKKSNSVGTMLNSRGHIKNLDVQDSSRQSLQQVSKLTSLQLNSVTSKCSTVNCDNYVNSEGSCCKHCSSWLTLDVDSPQPITKVVIDDVLIYAQ